MYLTAHRECLMGQVTPIEHIMLKHEEHVEDDGEEPQSELSGVPKEAAPVVVVVGDEEHLQHAQAASGEVQQDVADAPAHCTLPPADRYR